jgi:hypothetical protein
MGTAICRNNSCSHHRAVVWVILADFDGLFAVVAAVGM